MISVKASEASAEAFQVALNAAGADPETRLRMILGEAYQKYRILCHEALAEIHKDEGVAPGLKALAISFAAAPDRLVADRSIKIPAVADIQQRILEEAIALLYDIESKELAIEHDPA